MGRIDKIKIGGIYFDIVRKENLVHPVDNRRLDGHILYGESKIYLDDAMSPQAEMQTVWHEVVHGILTQAGMDAKENLIDCIAYGIIMVLVDNPQLADVKPK